MESGQHAREVGRHTLGPHVVGERVVVRRVVRGETGPTGGPAMTDVLGTCTAWDDGVCTVAPENGTPVSIPLADIVSGKPVPPRPSVRQRVSAREAEGYAAVLWPRVVRQQLGEWELRSDPAPDGRLLKRANSCLALGDPGTPYDDAARIVSEFYGARNRRPIVQVEADSDADDWFSEVGWESIVGGDSHFQIAPLAQLARRLRPVSRVNFEALLSEGVGARPLSVGLAAEGPRLHLELRSDGDLVAAAQAGLSGDWLGVHGFTVVPEHRRRGLARRMLAELVEWGGEKGATTVWLHVEADNEPALALYEGVGFRTHHSLRYLAVPG